MKKEKLDILYEDKSLIIVNKKSGILTIANDKEKEKLAIKHGVKKYIVIDARKSQSTFIKNSILMSDLSKIISTNTNWELCDLNASSSLLTIICNSWNKKYECIDKLAKDNQMINNKEYQM